MKRIVLMQVVMALILAAAITAEAVTRLMASVDYRQGRRVSELR